jgi:hypothetical protein
MSDLTRLTVWDDPAIRGALSWYLDVAENRRPAKFRIAATVATNIHVPVSSLIAKKTIRLERGVQIRKEHLGMCLAY